MAVLFRWRVDQAVQEMAVEFQLRVAMAQVVLVERSPWLLAPVAARMAVR